MDPTADKALANTCVRRLRAHGHRLTSQRETVVQVLVRNRNHPLTPEQVYDAARALRSPVCLVSALRSLVRGQHDFEVTQHCLSFFGYCQRYQKRQ